MEYEIGEDMGVASEVYKIKVLITFAPQFEIKTNEDYTVLALGVVIYCHDGPRLKKLSLKTIFTLHIVQKSCGTTSRSPFLERRAPHRHRGRIISYFR